MLTYNFNVTTSKRCRDWTWTWLNLCETPRDHGRTNVAVSEWSCQLLATWMHSHHSAIKVYSLAACPTVYCMQYKTVVTIHARVHGWSPTTLSDSAVHRCFACLCDGHAVRHTSVMAPNVWNSLVNDISSLLTLFVNPKTHIYCCVLVINIDIICKPLYWLLVGIMFAI